MPAKLFSTPTNASAAFSHGKSPVDFFRQLLAMTPDERDDFLTNRPPEIRARILAKVAEYEALNPNDRELRLRATELRWYLMPLLRESPTNRAARLAQMPADMRELVKTGLKNGTFCRHRCNRNFWTTNASCMTSHIWTSATIPRKILARTKRSRRAHGNGFRNRTPSGRRRIKPVF